MYEIRTTAGELIAEAVDGYAVRVAIDTLTAEGYRDLVDPFTGPIVPAVEDGRTHLAAAVRVERQGKSPRFTARCSCGWATSCDTASKAEAHRWADTHTARS